eukprot:6127464-Prymnesium_polylepis.1
MVFSTPGRRHAVVSYLFWKIARCRFLRHANNCTAPLCRGRSGCSTRSLGWWVKVVLSRQTVHSCVA